MILVVAYPNDLHADTVETFLRKKKATYYRLNYGLFPELMNISFEISDTAHSSETITLGQHQYSLRDVKSAWFRTPSQARVSGNTSKTLKNYITRESQRFLDGIGYMTPHIFWVSNPVDINAAEYKYRQLQIAKEIGFKFPHSLFGNDLANGEHFVKNHTTLALKPFYMGVLQLDLSFWQKIKKLIYDLKNKKLLQKHADNPEYLKLLQYSSTMRMETKRFDSKDARLYLEGLSNCPVILQEYIPKQYELRITVVGKKIFPCAIYTQDIAGTNKSDWRAQTYQFRHEMIQLPQEIEERCFQLLERLKLQFGCIDMIVTPDNDYVFLEINPHGQWLWIEDLTGAKISESIADLLISRDGL
ncbi:MAG: hypothetical protein VKJ04_00165 [Vampirovibrionales bacterium]|nr:hypothetical protein [Vampirovibrionales bacterium]